MQVKIFCGHEIPWNENCGKCSRKKKKHFTLQGTAAASASPWQRWREHEVLESESQGYSLYSCVNNTTPLWKNITSLVRVMKKHISDLCSRCTSRSVNMEKEKKKPAIKVKARKWTAQIWFSLSKTKVEVRPDFWLLQGHTIPGLAHLKRLIMVRTIAIEFSPRYGTGISGGSSVKSNES